MTNKSITLALPECCENWIAQDEDYSVSAFQNEPIDDINCFVPASGCVMNVCPAGNFLKLENWRDSKINLNTHSAYMDADGILRKGEPK